jgi:catechol 2,3-dioxygenase-like lactoylglutathione lyase family enzyme
MAAIKNISVMSVPVSDQDRAKAFYVDTLGFDEIADNEAGPNMRWIQLAPPGSETSISLVDWWDDFVPGSLRGNVLDVDDLATIKEELVGRGLVFTGEDDQTPWGTFAYFTDPDGNRWMLREPAAGE